MDRPRDQVRTESDTVAAIALQRCDLLAGVPWSSIQQLAAAAKLTYAARYEPLFRTGDTATAIYVLQQGLVVVGLEISGSRHVVTAVHGPGRAIGWSSVLEGLARPVSAFAVEDSSIWSISTGAVRDMADSDPEFGTVFYRNMAQRALRTVSTLAGQLRAHTDTSDKMERCPMLLKDSFFLWRINGAMVEVKCAGGPGCSDKGAACPIKASTPQWKTLMLGRFGAVSASGGTAKSSAYRERENDLKVRN